MNAQSSRSHAIFSLTLTQKKYSGSVPSVRSSSPLPPAGRSPSRLARPGSMYAGGPSPTSNRVSSPTPGRPSTPSFASAISRGGGGLRPASALGHMGDRLSSPNDDEGGDCVTIVSKFHFVDLAGSERVRPSLFLFVLSRTDFADENIISWNFSSSAPPLRENASKRVFPLTVGFLRLGMLYPPSEAQHALNPIPRLTFPTAIPS